MNNSGKNRLHDYEAGWLTLLIKMGIATEKEARDAMCRVDRKAIDDMRKQQKKRPSTRKKQG